jgi:hypothetical protein
MDYMKENAQVSITQITTAYVSCVFIVALSIVNALLHSNSLLIVAGSAVAGIVATAVMLCFIQKLGRSLKT